MKKNFLFFQIEKKDDKIEFKIHAHTVTIIFLILLIVLTR